MSLRLLIPTICCLLILHQATAQKTKPATAPQNSAQEGDSSRIITTSKSKPTVELNPGGKAKEDLLKIKVKKRKKNVFYGIKSRRRFTRTYRGNRVVVEKVYVLRQYQEPNRFVPEIYYFDLKTLSVQKIVPEKYKPEMGMPLHGSYERLIDGVVAETGFYYVGTKHGRWEKYAGDLLLDKEKYYKGHPKEADIAYFDADKTKVKEVTPKQYGELDGMYLHYYKSGRLKAKGRYEDGVKVGRWLEYFDQDKNRLQRETQYPNNPHDTKTQPRIVREYDVSGKTLIDPKKR